MTVIAGRYEVGELLGRGGMAEVFAGVDRRLDRPVAIKLLRPEISARPDLRTRFEAEARAAASLSHPNAVAVFDTGEEDGVPYIVMERLPGETLADRIAAGPVAPSDVKQIAGEVLGALGAAHATGLAHRDVKPGNILMAADGQAKVADFGIAKSVENDAGAADLTGTGQLLGTPAYLAPERLAGAPATAQSDIYALGIVLYEALSGVKPFDGATPIATAQAITNGVFPPLRETSPDVDPALAATVERAMAADPARRFSSTAEMAVAISAAPVVGATDTVDLRAGDTAILDLPPVVAATGPAPDRRRLPIAGVIVAGLGALLAIVLLAGVGSGGGSSDSPQVAGASSTSTSPTTSVSSEQSLAEALRERAAATSAADGSLGPQVAARLNQIADAVAAGDGGSGATALLAVVPVWNRTGLLSDSATAAAVDLVKQVPGVNLTAYNAVATTVAPAPIPPADNEGRGKGKKDD
ncbi:MAG TPA: serine/threonine-protein kinase [Acidimicrobiales bacterium]|nr:serine/threonine-protein kinase [Acidimicrobiales bacterium]